MMDFRRQVHKEGQRRAVIVPPTPPSYVGGGIFSTYHNTRCLEKYYPFTFETMPESISLVTGASTLTGGQNIIGVYSGYGKKYLNITNFTAVSNPGSVPDSSVGKLFYNGIEVTSFPLQIDVSGLAPDEPTGLVVGLQAFPPCRLNNGFRLELKFTITDIYNNTGVIGTWVRSKTFTP